jgi:spore coat protein U-like protein
MRSRTPWLTAGLAVIAIALGLTPLSSRAGCLLSATISPAFGSVSTLNDGAAATGGVLGLCGLGNTGQVALSVGLGVGASVNTRYLTGPGGTQIPYNLYSNLAGTSVWGSTLGTNTVSLTGVIVQTLVVYAQIAPGTTIPAIGTFTDTVSVDLYFNGVSQGLGSLTVTLTTVGSCSVGGGTLNFGSASLLTTNLDGTGTITVNCTNTAPYAVALDNGSNYLSGRQMTDGLFHYIKYQLYTDAARSQPWTSAASNTSCTSPNSCDLGTGSGAIQNLTVYGRVPPQSGAPPGVYTDFLIITITY